MSKWQVIYKTPQLHKAEIVKAILFDRGLSPILLDKQDSNYKIGYFEVVVAPDEVLKAIKIVENEIDIK